MKNQKYWKHEKEFDTKTLFGNPETFPNGVKDKSETNGDKIVQIGKDKSEQLSADLNNKDAKLTKNASDFKELSSFNEYLFNSNETKVYEPRPLTPDDEIYEDVMEQFASAPTKPKYWFEELGDYWSCSCGHINKGERCNNCGLERELLRSLFILHKPAGEPGKLNKKLKKTKDMVDKEDIRQTAIEEQRRKCEEARGDNLIVVPIEEDTGPLDDSETSNEPLPSDIDNISSDSDDTEIKTSCKPDDETLESSAKDEEKKDSLQDNTEGDNTVKDSSDDTTKNESEEKLSDNLPSVITPPKKNILQGITLKKKLIALILLLVILATAGGIGVYKYLAAPAIQYDEAMKLQETGKYEKAIAKFEALGDYRDSDHQIWRCYILWGDSQYSNGEYEEAIKTYNIALERKSSDKILKKIRKCHIGIGDNYYAAEQYDKALASYNTAMEMEESTQLQEKINKAKFGYIEAYKSKRTKEVEQYLSDLMAIKFPGIQEIYDEYYAWHAKLIANTTDSDFSTDLSSVNLNDIVYFHITLSGGEPSEEIRLYYEITWPNGATQVHNLDSSWKTGSKITARFQYPIPLFGSEGKLTFKLYDKSNNELLGSDSVTFED